MSAAKPVAQTCFSGLRPLCMRPGMAADLEPLIRATDYDPGNRRPHNSGVCASRDECGVDVTLCPRVLYFAPLKKSWRIFCLTPSTESVTT